MKKSYLFQEKFTNINPHLNSLYSYSVVRGGISNRIHVREWVIEYHYGYAGEIYFSLSGAKKTCGREKHMVHLYAPGCVFIEDTRKSELPRRETHLHFRGGETCGLNNIVNEKLKYCRFLDREKLIGTILEKCISLCDKDAKRAFMEIQSLMFNCISLMLNFSKKLADDTYEISSRPLTDNLFIKEAEIYMRQNISSGITNADIAKHLQTSESTFTHKFKQITNVSPGKTMTKIKIDLAKGLIFKGKKLKEIAELTGFHDEYHLSKVFKNMTGMTPTDFRKKQAEP